MATPYAIRPVCSALLALALIASLTTACKKSVFGGADVDPRDQYVGTYNGTSRRTYYVSADIFQGPIPGTATTNITKSSNAGEIYIENTVVFNGGFTGGYTVRVTATLDGPNFTVIDKRADQIDLPNGKVTSDYAASGTFDAATKQIVYSATARALRNGAQYSRTDEITNTRK
ncbi:MAG TPA: hypothetical protein VK404_19730 [Spirosoma sp.]|jgi:hypothetical protein|nr:hypothetical protein [Spirosoma sp.]